MGDFFRKIKSFGYRSWREMVQSIAFYPTVITLLFFVVAVLILTFEKPEFTRQFNEWFPFLVINNADTARSILATLIGGIISLTVFSFSMVMVMLNQASSNFSPRLLPGLISDKRNQLVLGVYLGTIIYNIVVLISILPDGDNYMLNGIAVLLGIFSGIFSLGLFVYFIHSISTGIQIQTILKKIYHEVKDRLEWLAEKDESHRETKSLDSPQGMIQAEMVGYFQGVNLAGVSQVANKAKCHVKILPIKGEYIFHATPIFEYYSTLEKEQIEELQNHIIVSPTEKIDENYVLGVKQMVEVGVKALSPGINDPGTALTTLDYLMDILSIRMKLADREVYHTDDGHMVEVHTVNFQELLSTTITSYRQYALGDVIVLRKLIQLLNYLKTVKCENENYEKAIKEELEKLHEDIERAVENSGDRQFLLNSIQKNK